MVTAALVTFNREREIRKVEAHLRASGLFADVIVWRNKPSDNRMVYGRYLAAAQARTELIYTQDDDCLVDNLEELVDAFDGKHLVSALKPNVADVYKKKFGRAQVTLVGWGAVFRRDWLSVFDRYIEHYGVDDLLLREADRIFTLLLNRPHHSLPAKIREFPSAVSERALSQQRNHWSYFYAAVERAAAIKASARSVPS